MTSVASAWTDIVLPVLERTWPQPTPDALPERGQGAGFADFMKAYTTLYNLCSSSRTPPSLKEREELVTTHLDAFVTVWVRAARTYIANGDVLQRYLAAWAALQASMPLTTQLFKYTDRAFFPLKDRSLGAVSRLPLDMGVCSAATVLRRWRTEVVLPLFGEAAHNGALPADDEQRKKLAEGLRTSFIACGVEEKDSILSGLE